MGLYVHESLRAWNACAQYFRERASFTTTAGTTFYDLSPSLSSDSGQIFARTATDRGLVDVAVRHLMESVTADYAWSGTEMFTLDEVADALQRRRDRFLMETGVVLTETTTALVEAGTPRVTLSDSVIDVRRVAWKDRAGAYSHLWREDEERLRLLYGGSYVTTPAPPEAYSTALLPHASLLLAPAPSDSGYLHLVTVSAGAALDPSTGVPLGVPDDFAWVVKYGALADLLSNDGQARDAGRAAYCEQRWKEGLILARLASSVLHAEINGQPVDAVSLFDLDAGEPGWQNVTGQPAQLALAGHNLVALSPVPAVTSDAPDGVFHVAVDVVRNAPVPEVESSQVQVGRELLGVLLDYCVEVAMFKCGGAEFAASQGGYIRLLEAAMGHSERLRAQAWSFESLHRKAQKEGEQRPVRREAAA